LIALQDAVKAKYLFGHSFGGIIALQAANQLGINKIAVYEPPVSINNSIPADWLPEFAEALKKNKKVKAMAIFLKGLQVPEVSKFPRPILMLLVYLINFLERKKEKETRILNLLHTVPADMRIVKQLEPEFEKYRQIKTETLLMSGSNSQLFFQQSVTELGQAIPGAQVKIFAGFDHYSPEEKVEEIGLVLKEFFQEKV
jgi:pimeloyl-ACP methyl ester carboxylesterase